MDFVSPEHVRECIHLAEEIRVLPQNHIAKVDKLEVYNYLHILVSLGFFRFFWVTVRSHSYLNVFFFGYTFGLCVATD